MKVDNLLEINKKIKDELWKLKSDKNMCISDSRVLEMKFFIICPELCYINRAFNNYRDRAIDKVKRILRFK